MRIAIMGAGMAGLSCAITLERFGLKPVLFEKRKCPGDRFVNAEAMFGMMSRPAKDCLAYLREKHGIALKPISAVHRIVIHSKHDTGSIEGDLGYTNVRGRREDSYESQLARQVKAAIHFDSERTYESLCREYGTVVLATGDGLDAACLGNYRCDVTATIRGATVEGRFEPDTPHVWFDYDIVPKGYAWLIPFSRNEAHLVIAYPGYPGNIKKGIDVLWSRFFSLACVQLGQLLRVTDRFEIARYMMGRCLRPKIERTYFTGNCMGALTPGMGFGQFASILSGVYAAWDIAGRGDYKALAQPLLLNHRHSLVLRRYLESLDNDKLDRHVRRLGCRAVSGLARYFASNCAADVLKWCTPLMRASASLNERRRTPPAPRP